MNNDDLTEFLKSQGFTDEEIAAALASPNAIEPKQKPPAGPQRDIEDFLVGPADREPEDEAVPSEEQENDVQFAAKLKSRRVPEEVSEDLQAQYDQRDREAWAEHLQEQKDRRFFMTPTRRDLLAALPDCNDPECVEGSPCLWCAKTPADIENAKRKMAPHIYADRD